MLLKLLRQRPWWSFFLQKQALTTSLQNICSKQQQTLSGKLARVFEKDFTIDVLLNKKLWKAKIKASKGKKDFTMPMVTPTSIPILMPRCRCQCRDFQMAESSKIKKGKSRTIYFFFQLKFVRMKKFL